MSTKTQSRVPSSVTDANVQLDKQLRDAYHHMNLKTYKAVKNGILSFVLLGFAYVLVLEGADPTLVFTGTLVVVTLLNGIELAEFLDAWAAVRSGDTQTQRREDNE